jgi:hypothetical protein
MSHALLAALHSAAADGERTFRLDELHDATFEREFMAALPLGIEHGRVPGTQEFAARCELHQNSELRKKRRHFDALRTFVASAVRLGVPLVVAVTHLSFASEGAMDAETRPDPSWPAGHGLVNWAKSLPEWHRSPEDNGQHQRTESCERRRRQSARGLFFDTRAFALEED